MMILYKSKYFVKKKKERNTDNMGLKLYPN